MGMQNKVLPPLLNVLLAACLPVAAVSRTMPNAGTIHGEAKRYEANNEQVTER
ncbi:MAG: hypothetical protein ABSG34_05190 [Candidatus Sulfotelmatobacter sp.]|jgi:hypothetical protein